MYKEQLKKFIEDKLRKVPHGVDLNIFFPQKKPEVFTFICNKGFRTEWDRGGMQYAIQAFLQEFKKGEAIMKIKINPAYGTDFILNYLKKKSNYLSPDIFIDSSFIPYNKMAQVYQGHVLVAPSRAEGFGLNGLESHACSLMTIQTAFGGQIDYMNNETDLFIDYKLVPVKSELYYEECQWAIPSIKDLRTKMRWCYEHQNEVKQRGEQARQDVLNWTWDISAQKAIGFLKEIRDIK